MLYMPSSGEGYGGGCPLVDYMFIPPQTWIV